MKYSSVFIIILFVSYTRDVGGKSVLDFLIDLVAPRNPELNRVRRIEDANDDPYAVLDTVGLVERYGYSAEQHNLTTEDGYNIVFFRISGSPKSPAAKGKPIVFLQHGMISSSDSWVLIGPHHDLAFLLVDAGYDVWLGNIRGNTYCRSNTNLSTTDKEFWEFSWHECGTIDLPNMIDYALDYTGQKTLFYVGISMGTTMSYALLSEKPEYNVKFRLIISLAPVGSWKYTSNILYQLSILYGPSIKDAAYSIGIYDIAPQTRSTAVLVEAFCGSHSSTQRLCFAWGQIALSLLAGVPGDGLNFTMMPHLFKYFPAGVSGNTLLHYQQCYKTGVLTKFDHGATKNLRLYGSEEPPLYNLSRVVAPIVLIYGKTDELAREKNVKELAKLLPNVVSCKAVEARPFNHLDFGVSPRAKELVYDKVIDFFSKY